MATAVIVNRVASAKAIYDRLRSIGYVDTILLTGRMRPVDRDLSISAWTPFLKTGSAIRNNISKPMIVVSTQCLEVGADLDFDGLVTECAAFDALCQRFGRLNRGGRDIDSKAIIIWWPGPQKADKCESERGTATPVKGSDDPVYGPALKKTWTFLKTQQRGRGKDKVIQMGIEDVRLMQEQHQEDLGRMLFTFAKCADIVSSPSGFARPNGSCAMPGSGHLIISARLWQGSDGRASLLASRYFVQIARPAEMD